MESSEIEDKDRILKGLHEAFENEKLNFDPKNWEVHSKMGRKETIVH